MWMIILVMATKASLSAVLYRNDDTITPDMVWPDKVACDTVLEQHLLQYPAPPTAALVCLQVPDHVSKKYLRSKKPSVIDA
jgi:hypothetical protein